MTINFKAKTDKHSARLTLADEKLAPIDRIIFSEACFKVGDDSISVYGFLNSESFGITNYNDKDWKPEGQEALLTIHKSKKQKWNDSIKKYEMVEVSVSENYLYTLLSSKLNSFPADQIICLGVTPYIPPVFFEMLDEQTKPGLDPAVFQVQARMLEKMVESTCVATIVSQDKIRDEHRLLLEKEANTSARTWNGIKAETEAEKLEARWQFVKKHLVVIGQFDTIGDVAIAVVKSDEQKNRDQICEAISILSQLLP